MYYRPPCINLRNNTLFSFLITCHLEITGILNCEDGVVYALVGNGFCNDETNNAACNFDGGDCCGCDVNQEHCSKCKCLGCKYTHLVSNGICNDESNNKDCSYDGGDCCLLEPNKDHCTECLCATTGFITSPGYPIPNIPLKNPREYDNSLDKFWRIQVPSGKLIELNITSFNVTGSKFVGWRKACL